MTARLKFFDIGSTKENAALVNVLEGKEILSLFQKSQDAWRMDWTSDEQFFIRATQQSTLEVFSPQDPSSNKSS